MSEFDMKAVESSQIEAIGYREDESKMRIRFKGWGGKTGSLYEYDNVPKDVHDGFFQAKEDDGSDRSVGRYFGRTVKNSPEKYPYRKIG